MYGSYVSRRPFFFNKGKFVLPELPLTGLSTWFNHLWFETTKVIHANNVNLKLAKGMFGKIYYNIFYKYL